MSGTNNHFLNESLGQITSIEKTNSGIAANTSKEHMEVIFYTDNIARIRLSRNEQFDEFSYSVIATPEEVNFDYSQKG